MKLYFCFVFLYFRAKIFRGKKVQGDYDVKVEQVKHFTVHLLASILCVIV